MKASVKKFRDDYVNGDSALAPFFAYSAVGPNFAAIMRDKAEQPLDRELLVELLNDQYSGFDLPPALEQNIRKLADTDSFTVTTGHQLVLFGGPMFTVYKVLSTIKVCEHLQAEYPQSHFVPVFWIHTEDHDYEEINHYYRDYDHKLSYGAPFSGPVGRHILTDEIQNLVPPHFQGVYKSAFSPGRSLAEAYRIFFHELFGDHGLVILDPDDIRLKRRLIPVLKAEMAESPIAPLVEQSIAAMKAAGYSAPVNPRDINFFYMDDEGRDRILREGDGFRVVDRGLRFSREEMDRLVAERPDLFSPNVITRPLYQEILLPNLAYIGGWAEVNYWLELRSMFAHFGVNFPLVLPRFSATLFEEDQMRKWKKLGLDPEDIDLPLAELQKKLMPEIWDPAALEPYSRQIRAAYDELKSYVEEQFEPSMGRTMEGQKAKTDRFFQSLEKKIQRVLKAKYASKFDALAAARHSIQPEGKIQERVLGLPAFAGYSPRELVDYLHDPCSPLTLHKHFWVMEAESVSE